MKIHAAIAIVFLCQVCNAQTEHEDSLISYNWEANDSAWIRDIKTVSTYDNNGNPVEEFRWEWTDSTWVNYKKSALSYSSSGNVLSQTDVRWNGTNWENELEQTWSYDSNENLLGSTIRNWNGSAWENSGRYVSTYDGNNRLIQTLDETWNGAAWENSYLQTYSYSINEDTLEITGQSWGGSAWLNAARDVIVYNQDGNEDMRLNQDWNNAMWENDTRIFYYYELNSQVASYSELWDGGNWVSEFFDTIIYDNNGSVARTTLMEWISSAWENVDQNLNSYNAAGNRTENIYQLWNGAEWENYIKQVWFYPETASIPVLSGNNEITVFVNPNPFSGQVSFVMTDHAAVPYSESFLLIYDMLGVIIKSVSFDKEYTLLENLPSGIYLYTVLHGGAVSARGKIIAD